MSAQGRDYNTIVCKQKRIPPSRLFGELWIYDKALLAVFQNLLLSDLLSFCSKITCRITWRDKVHFSVFWILLMTAAAAAAKSLQSCLTLCDPIDGSPPGSPIPGILQTRTLEWVAISFSNAWKWKVKVKSLSHVRLFVTPWTTAYQASPSMGFSRQEYWSGVPLPSPSLYLEYIKRILLTQQ